MTRMPSTQSRCVVCNRILLEGACLEGCNPADVAPTASPGPVLDEGMPTSQYVPLDGPIFSEEQRRQAAANMEERIRAQTVRAAAPSSNHAAGVSSASSSGGHALSLAAGLGSGSAAAEGSRNIYMGLASTVTQWSPQLSPTEQGESRMRAESHR